MSGVGVVLNALFGLDPSIVILIGSGILLIMSYFYYFVRSYLENDAMIKAKFLAKDYMEEIKLSEKTEIDPIIESYEKLNNMGIKITNFELMLETMIKVIIVLITFLI